MLNYGPFPASGALNLLSKTQAQTFSDDKEVQHHSRENKPQIQTSLNLLCRALFCLFWSEGF